MPAAVAFADGRLRELCGVERQVSKRHDLVVAAVIEKDEGYPRQPACEIGRQLEIIEIPVLVVPGWSREEDERCDRVGDMLLREVSQQGGTAERMPYQDGRTVRGSDLRGDSRAPRLQVGVGLVRHARIAHVVVAAECRLQRRGERGVFVVGTLSTTLYEEHRLLHAPCPSNASSSMDSPSTTLTSRRSSSALSGVRGGGCHGALR